MDEIGTYPTRALLRRRGIDLSECHAYVEEADGLLYRCTRPAHGQYVNAWDGKRHLDSLRGLCADHAVHPWIAR
jgi:hypothetical protein